MNDIRVGVSVLRPPSVQERVTAPNGTAASYTWNDLGSWNLRFEALYLQGMSRRGRGLGGFVWGVGALYGDAKTTPDSYSTGNGITTSNTRSDLELHYHEYGLSLVAGLATAPIPYEVGSLTWELLPIGRFGIARADTVTPGFSTSVASGQSWFWEGGVRGGVTVVDNGWTIGLHLGWLYGKSTFNIGLGSTGESRLLIVRNGPEAGLEIGLRF